MDKAVFLKQAEQAGFDTWEGEVAFENIICTEELKRFYVLVHDSAVRTCAGFLEEEYTEHGIALAMRAQLLIDKASS